MFEGDGVDILRLAEDLIKEPDKAKRLLAQEGALDALIKNPAIMMSLLAQQKEALNAALGKILKTIKDQAEQSDALKVCVICLEMMEMKTNNERLNLIRDNKVFLDQHPEVLKVFEGNRGILAAFNQVESEELNQYDLTEERLSPEEVVAVRQFADEMRGQSEKGKEKEDIEHNKSENKSYGAVVQPVVNAKPAMEEVPLPAKAEIKKEQNMNPDYRARLDGLFARGNEDPFTPSLKNLPHKVIAAYRSIRDIPISEITKYMIDNPLRAEAFLKKQKGSAVPMTRNFREEFARNPQQMIELGKAALGSHLLLKAIQNTDLMKTRHLSESDRNKIRVALNEHTDKIEQDQAQRAYKEASELVNDIFDRENDVTEEAEALIRELFDKDAISEEVDEMLDDIFDSEEKTSDKKVSSLKSTMVTAAEIYRELQKQHDNEPAIKRINPALSNNQKMINRFADNMDRYLILLAKNKPLTDQQHQKLAMMQKRMPGIVKIAAHDPEKKQQALANILQYKLREITEKLEEPKIRAEVQARNEADFDRYSQSIVQNKHLNDHRNDVLAKLDGIQNQELKSLLKARFNEGFEKGLNKDLPPLAQMDDLVKKINHELNPAGGKGLYHNKLVVIVESVFAEKAGIPRSPVHTFFNIPASEFPRAGKSAFVNDAPALKTGVEQNAKPMENSSSALKK